MRYVIFSDIHGNALAFNSFLADIKNIEYDKLVFLGDFLGYYYAPEEIISYCIENEVICLLGNHDSYFLEMLAGSLKEEILVSRYGYSYTKAKETISDRSIKFLKSLQSFLFINDGLKNKIFFCHGSPLDTLNGRIYPDTDLNQFKNAVTDFSYVIFGHTHHKLLHTLGDTVFINPGSLGQQRDGLGCSYIFLDTTDKKINFRTISYDIYALEAMVDQYDNGNIRLKSVLRRAPVENKIKNGN